MSLTSTFPHLKEKKEGQIAPTKRTKKKKNTHTYQEKETAKVRAKKKFSIVKDIRNRAP